MSWNTPPTPLAMFNSNDQAVPDVTLFVGDSRINAHKSYLSLVSPVFKAMFEHPTKEAETGQVHVTDFLSKTVQKAIDYLYGQALTDASHQEVFDIYRFVDKYDIDAARKLLAKCFQEPVNYDTFFVNAKFAWTYSNEAIMSNCVDYLEISKDLVFTSKFQDLGQSLIMELLQRTTVIVERKLRISVIAAVLRKHNLPK